MTATKSLDTTGLVITASGSLINLPSALGIRCTITLAPQSNIQSRSVHVQITNDSDAHLRITAGFRTGLWAELYTDLEFLCAPRDELIFDYAGSLFSLAERRAFVVVQTAQDACGVLGPEIDGRARSCAFIAGGLLAAAAVAYAASVYLKKARDRSARAKPENTAPANQSRPAEKKPPTERSQLAVHGSYEPPTVGAQQSTSRPFTVTRLGEVIRDVDLPGEESVVGSITCIGRHPMNVVFVAMVANPRGEALLCWVVGQTRSGEPVIFPDHFWVAPNSAAAVEINARARYPWKVDTLVLHMQNSTTSSTTEARVPVPTVMQAARLSAIGIVLALLTAAAVIVGTRPRIAALAAPTSVIAGQMVSASYETTGWGSAAYSVRDRRGLVRAGPLPMGRHNVRFPTGKQPETYHMTLRVKGFAGASSLQQEITAILAPHALAPPAISALEASPTVVVSGAHFDVRYILHASSNNAGVGTVSILDSGGFPLATAPTNGSGTTPLTAPAVTSPTAFRIALTYTQNGERTQGGAGVLVMPKQGIAPALQVGDFKADQLFRITPQNPRSGELLTVRPLQKLSSLTITLQDSRGAPIGSVDVGSQGRVAEFRLPYVPRDQKMTIVASYQLNGAQHVAIQPIIVRAGS